VRAEHGTVRRVLADERQSLVERRTFGERVDRFYRDAPFTRDRHHRFHATHVRAGEQPVELRAFEDFEQAARLQMAASRQRAQLIVAIPHAAFSRLGVANEIHRHDGPPRGLWSTAATRRRSCSYDSSVPASGADIQRRSSTSSFGSHAF